MKNLEKAREARLRRLAKKKDLRLVKSRVRNTHINNHGKYRLVEIYNNTVLDGVNYELKLDNVEYVLNRS